MHSLYTFHCDISCFIAPSTPFTAVSYQLALTVLPKLPNTKFSLQFDRPESIQKHHVVDVQKHD